MRQFSIILCLLIVLTVFAQQSNAGAIDFVDGADQSTEYTYDGNGLREAPEHQLERKSLTSDANKGISLIEYDNNNMPRRIQFSNGNTIEYIYTTDGQKLRTIYYTAATQQRDSTEYFLGGLLTRKNNSLDKYLFDGGYCSFSNTNTPTCHYYNRDHLGNIREVIGETGAIEQVTHYYPFGTPFSDNSVTNPALQSYKYNGKEFDTAYKLNTYDYGARQYDPLLVVWHGVDPMCEKDYGTGVSVYCRNNPVKHLDHDGNFPDIIWDVANVLLGVKSLSDNVKQGNWGAVIVDGVGIVADATAAVLPGIPGGVSTAINTDRAIRTTGTVAESTANISKGLKTYQTYTKVHPQTGKIYVGRTSGTKSPFQNVKNRDRNHHMNKEGFGPAKLDKSSANKDAIRGREQTQIEKHGGAQSSGGTSGNKINGISPTNNNREHYIKMTKKKFGE